MNMEAIRKKANALGVDPGKLKKAALIHAIQKFEGYTACFGKSKGACPFMDCCWREDCLP